MGSQGIPEQLNILIVGAGIAGLTAATALKHAGHKVTIFESSRLLHEVGAAVTLAPNGTPVLSRLGFDFDAAKGVRIKSVTPYSGVTLETPPSFPPRHMDGIEEALGFPYRAFHRVDLHNGLRKMAFKVDERGVDVELFLGVRIVRVDVANAEIELDDGRIWTGDLLVGADGVHSIVKKAALRFENVFGADESEDAGWDIYRWLLDTSELKKDPEIAGLMKANTMNTYILPHEGKTLRLVWYSCRNGEIQNLAALCPAKRGEQAREDFNASADKENVLDLFNGYHPTLLNLMRRAEGMKSWRLLCRKPLPTYVYAKTVLIGDAAHPMLPFNAQGTNQALEDAGALLSLLSNIFAKEDLPERLRMFDAVRRKRASREQIISSVPNEEVRMLGEKLKGYENEHRVAGTESVRERILKELGHDIFRECDEILRRNT